MSCNNVQILNFNHNIVEVGSDNKLIITDNVKCNSITIPQPVTNILQINSPGPQGPAGAAGTSVNTGSFVTTSSFNAYTGSSTSQFAGTSSFAFTASYALNAGTTIDTGSFVTTSSFNAFTQSINTATSSFVTNSQTSSFITTSSFNTFTSSYNTFTSSYNTGSFSGSFIGSLQGTASWAESASVAISSSFATTASYALNVGTTIDTGSFVTTSSFNTFTSSFNTFTSSYNTGSFTGSFTGSLEGTSSWAYSSSVAISSSYATTASYALNAGTTIDTSAFVTTSSFNAFTQSINTATSSFVTTSSFNSFTSSYNTGSFSGSFTGSLFGTASFATSASQAISASYASNGGVTQLLAGPNITLSPTNGLGQVTINSTGGGSSFNTATGSYGSFYSTQTQTNVAGTARSMSLNTTDITNGVSVSGSTNPFNTYIKVENAGVYNIQFSAQIDKSDTGKDEIWIWLRKNGTDLTDTATSIQLTGNADHQVASWNFFANAAANDYFQLMWYSPDANVRLHAEPAFGVVPGIPSLIVTANRVDQFLSNTGSFSGSFTGNLVGTATTASYVSGSVFTSTNPVLSASFATTASYALTSEGGSGGISQGKVVAIATGYSNLF